MRVILLPILGLVVVGCSSGTSKNDGSETMAENAPALTYEQAMQDRPRRGGPEATPPPASTPGTAEEPGK